MCLDRSVARTSANSDFIALGRRLANGQQLTAKSQPLTAPFMTTGYTAEKEIAVVNQRQSEYQRRYIEKRIGTV